MPVLRIMSISCFLMWTEAFLRRNLHAVMSEVTSDGSKLGQKWAGFNHHMPEISLRGLKQSHLY